MQRQGRKAAERGDALARTPGFLGRLVALAIRSSETLLPPTLTRLPRRFATHVTVSLTIVTFTSTPEAEYRKRASHSSPPAACRVPCALTPFPSAPALRVGARAEGAPELRPARPDGGA